MEVALLLVIFLAYGFNNGGAVGYILLSISSWFMALSWLFAPYLFNPSGFEWEKLLMTGEIGGSGWVIEVVLE